MRGAPRTQPWLVRTRRAGFFAFLAAADLRRDADLAVAVESLRADLAEDEEAVEERERVSAGLGFLLLHPLETRRGGAGRLLRAVGGRRATAVFFLLLLGAFFGAAEASEEERRLTHSTS